MAEPLVFECPSCGSPVTTDGKQMQVTCQYCGRVVTVPEELRPHEDSEPAWQGQPVVVIDPREAVREAMRERESERQAERETNRTRPSTSRRGSGCGCTIPTILLVMAVGALYYFFPTQSIGVLKAAAGMPTPKPTVVPVTRPLASPPGQKISYANLLFSVTGGTITNQTPAGAGFDERQLRTDQAHAYLDVKVNNPTADGIPADRNLVTLQLADGRRYREESGWADQINGQSTEEKRLYFNVPVTTTWQGAQLVIGLPGKEPAVLPLQGPAAPARYPADVKAIGKTTVADIDYEIKSASLDLDANGNRAATGRRFLIFNMRMFNRSPGGYNTAISNQNFRLAVGEDMLAPVKAPIEVVNASSVLQGEVIFDIPANAQRVELQVGEVGRNDTRRLPVTLPTQ